MSDVRQRIGDLSSQQQALLQLRLFETLAVAEVAEAIVQRRAVRTYRGELARLMGALDACSRHRPPPAARRSDRRTM